MPTLGVSVLMCAASKRSLSAWLSAAVTALNDISAVSRVLKLAEWDTSFGLGRFVGSREYLWANQQVLYDTPRFHQSHQEVPAALQSEIERSRECKIRLHFTQTLLLFVPLSCIVLALLSYRTVIQRTLVVDSSAKRRRQRMSNLSPYHFSISLRPSTLKLLRLSCKTSATLVAKYFRTISSTVIDVNDTLSRASTNRKSIFLGYESAGTAVHYHRAERLHAKILGVGSSAYSAYLIESATIDVVLSNRSR